MFGDPNTIQQSLLSLQTIPASFFRLSIHQRFFQSSCFYQLICSHFNIFCFAICHIFALYDETMLVYLFHNNYLPYIHFGIYSSPIHSWPCLFLFYYTHLNNLFIFQIIYLPNFHFHIKELSHHRSVQILKPKSSGQIIDMHFEISTNTLVTLKKLPLSSRDWGSMAEVDIFSGKESPNELKTETYLMVTLGYRKFLSKPQKQSQHHFWQAFFH